MEENAVESVMLSIIVPTYNHEKYIIKALDSILMQKTKYSYEVLVGEDASTDNTRTVLKAYEEKHPGKIQVFYREKNMQTEKYNNCTDLNLRSKGKYMVILEGDDYWTDEYKIEKQIDFLESHPEYTAVSHNCVVVDENNNPKEVRYPECKSKEYSLMHYVCGIFPGQSTTVMHRNFVTQNVFDKTILEKKLMPGDKILTFALATNGKVHCMQEVMSAYRHVTVAGSTSYSAKYKYDFIRDEYYWGELLQFARAQENEWGKRIMETMYFRNLLIGIKKKQLTGKEMKKYMPNIEHLGSTIVIYMCRLVYLVFRKRDVIR